eukprot:CAMPEP_0114329242 /NCGR_PEP_ID=MMETSP0101-20121206/952_1 /TAXON_ID=38822 ORGANISM="Pteridomonas danica, Strain PT" /NCGR_SAMPLE_ID=MMETSP0101 /ASSEMBLY_ACC=CAM_ASM_000211 /LENGTH=49 /DNA_ID=CAMNT_0001458851 /DNA_START=159 /DNA_END=308 /DNA_ORIENTATION=-
MESSQSLGPANDFGPSQSQLEHVVTVSSLSDKEDGDEAVVDKDEDEDDV